MIPYIENPNGTEVAGLLQRIDKILSSQGICTRKQAKELCKAGQVLADGVAIIRPDQKVDPDHTEISVSGNPVFFRRHIYLMMNKPQGVVSASRDRSTPTVVDLVPASLRRQGLFPAGRLDKDTTGFVLLTDDGGFAHKILSPKNHVPKTYLATVSGRVDDAVIQSFQKGIVLADGSRCKAAELKVLEVQNGLTVTEVVLREGMYHQIKRMFAACGCHVEKLHRVKIGGLELDESLAPGQCREILYKELKENLTD